MSCNLARNCVFTYKAKALRILKLLEEQHHKLAQIIETQNIVQQASVDAEPKSQITSSPEPRDTSTKAAASEKPLSSTRTRPGQPSLASARLGTQQRDSSPSLAREIASRRGIPPSGRNAPSPAAQARARQMSPESRRRVTATESRKVASSLADSQADLAQERKAKKAADDDGFAKFYSSLTTGTMSKLSSVLAYAGLPLTADDIIPEHPAKSTSNKSTVRAANDPDVKKIFSKAALDAIEEEHRQRGTLGHGFGPAESFYVVQKGGGTYSYADIARAHQQQLAGQGPDDEEPDFVDAKEVQNPTSPRQGRFPRSSSTRDPYGSARTNEELDLENVTLKQTLQDLASRLAAFEAHAQDASFAALTQSVANLRPPGAGLVADPAMHERVRQLEKQIESQAEERQKLESLASKQERMLKKYHSRFEEIKKSAKEKDKVKKEKEKEKAAAAAAGNEAEESPAEVLRES